MKFIFYLYFNQITLSAFSKFFLYFVFYCMIKFKWGAPDLTPCLKKRLQKKIKNLIKANFQKYCEELKKGKNNNYKTKTSTTTTTTTTTTTMKTTKTMKTTTTNTTKTTSHLRRCRSVLSSNRCSTLKGCPVKKVYNTI